MNTYLEEAKRLTDLYKEAAVRCETQIKFDMEHLWGELQNFTEEAEDEGLYEVAAALRYYGEQAYYTYCDATEEGVEEAWNWAMKRCKIIEAMLDYEAL